MSVPPLLPPLEVNPNWEALLSPLRATASLLSISIRCQLVFSLLVFLGLSVLEFLIFRFGRSMPVVKQRAGIFVGNRSSTSLGPERIFWAWNDPFPKSILHLHSTIIQLCMDEIALQESDRVINDPLLRLYLVDCTMDFIRNVLNPGVQGLFELLHTKQASGPEREFHASWGLLGHSGECHWGVWGVSLGFFALVNS